MDAHPFIKFVIIAMLVMIVVALGSAFFSLFRGRNAGTATVKALTVRVGLSIALFVLLMILAALGYIKPHGG